MEKQIAQNFLQKLYELKARDIEEQTNIHVSVKVTVTEKEKTA